MKKKINLIWQVDGFSSSIWERDWLIGLLHNFEMNEIMDGENKVLLDNSIIVTNGSARRVIKSSEYIKKFKEKGFRVGCFHISDEFAASPVDFYKYADFVFRNYYRGEVNKLKDCHYFGLGYKSAFCKSLVQKSINNRKYLFSFIGQLKSARKTMLEQAKEIKGDSFFYTTKSWEDPNQIPIEEYAKILNDSIFVLCPAGNISMDTFRFYEALEAGAIPIIENRTGHMVLKELAGRIFGWKSGVRCYVKYCYRLYQQVNYWQKAYGSDFLCPVIYDWRNLKALISKIDIEATAESTQNWWIRYKQSLTGLVTATIERKLF